MVYPIQTIYASNRTLNCVHITNYLWAEPNNFIYNVHMEREREREVGKINRTTREYVHFVFGAHTRSLTSFIIFHAFLSFSLSLSFSIYWYFQLEIEKQIILLLPFLIVSISIHYCRFYNLFFFFFFCSISVNWCNYFGNNAGIFIFWIPFWFI